MPERDLSLGLGSESFREGYKNDRFKMSEEGDR